MHGVRVEAHHTDGNVRPVMTPVGAAEIVGRLKGFSEEVVTEDLLTGSKDGEDDDE